MSTKSIIRKVSRMDADDLLDLVGLHRRHTLLQSLLPSLGYVALGAAIGIGMGVAFAPSSGRRFRRSVNERLDEMRQRMKSAQAEIKEGAERLVEQARSGTNAVP
jgi:hypothetical protein